MELNILASAYACEPHKGSEPGIGWNIVRQLAHRHNLWVITREDNRPRIERELSRHPIPGLYFIYFDLPDWASWWKQGTRGLQLYYYLWQIGAYQEAQELVKNQTFDLAHHITFGRYWSPSFLSRLPIPFVWGPIGGGESMPDPFCSDVSLQGQVYERLRETARWLGERDPFVEMTASQSQTALATTRETARKLEHLQVDRIELLGNAALSPREIDELGSPPPASDGPVRFASIGRLLHWKGFHLGLRAFAEADLDEGEFWIIGSGPERERLERLADSLGIGDRVTFWGKLSREETLTRLQQCHALVHPSLHDSGGWVCVEAMAIGRPVVCLNMGGPGLMVTDETGFKIDADTPEEAVRKLSVAVETTASNGSLRTRMSRQARQHARRHLSWEHKAERIHQIYMDILQGQSSDSATKMSAASS